MLLTSKKFLAALIVFQWMLIVYVLQHGQGSMPNEDHVSKAISSPVMNGISTRDSTYVVELEETPPIVQTGKRRAWKGVSATLALRAPRWFHRRYTTMLHNVLDNTPKDWAVQIFINPKWWSSEILKLHRGMHTLLQDERIVITELPEEYLRYKPKQIVIQPWFWKEMVADHIFLFSGNGVMCSHSLVSISAFDGMDFCGAPARGSGEGGDGGTHSIRSRRAMLDAIDFAKPGMDVGSESGFFTSTLKAMNKQTPGKYRLATKNQTILFGGGSELIVENHEVRQDFESHGPSLVMSGTGANLAWEIRDSLLQICPEWKLIFPSLHEPNCFGASPNADKCAASICALKPDRPKQGC